VLREGVPAQLLYLGAQHQSAPQIKLVGDAAQIRVQLGLPGEKIGPVRVRRKRQRVQVTLDVHRGARIGVVTPDTTDVLGTIDQDEVVDVSLPKPHRRGDRAEPGTDDRDVVMRDVACVHEWPPVRRRCRRGRVSLPTGPVHNARACSSDIWCRCSTVGCSTVGWSTVGWSTVGWSTVGCERLEPAQPPKDGRARRHEHRTEEILEAIVDFVLEHGSTGLSLRAVAAAAGISHATLLHHFGSEEALIAEVIAADRRAWIATAVAPHDLIDVLRDQWAAWSSPDRANVFALQFELYAVALREPHPNPTLVRTMVTDPLDTITAAAVDAGCPPTGARLVATSVLAELRGLVLDLILTQDRGRIDEAFEALLTRIENQRSTWSRDPWRASG
jgi:AcrR family transcriptional regulator